MAERLTPGDDAIAADRGCWSVAALRRVERDALARLPEGTLMARAAEAVADEADRMLRRMPRGTPVVALAGPGDNGADALLAAMQLSARGYRVAAYTLVADEPASADARAVHRRWRAEHGDPMPIASLATAAPAEPALAIDGLFGIGLARPLAGAAAAVARQLGELGWPVVAIDVPSGIDADTGGIAGGDTGVAVRAAATVTMIGAKPGLWTGDGLAHAGAVRVASLGLSLPPADGLAIDVRWARGRLAPRDPDSHKGRFGTVLVVGGADGMEGAALLAARGAQSGGAGKVIAASPDGRPFDPGQPQLMSRRLGRAPPTDADPFAGATVLAVGSGLGRSPAAAAWLGAALDASLPLVLDADALNLCAADAALADRISTRSNRAATVLTPHPLEAARLLGMPVGRVQADRVGAALRLATAHRCVVVLKGAGTVVAGPDACWAIVRAGGPSLATAGTGDVLAGLAAAMLAQPLPAFDAAALAAWVHGAAGDRWSAAHPMQRGLSAAALPDLVTEILDVLA